MAAKSKKCLNKTENKINLEKIQLKDVICSICQSIFVEPVTLPCGHSFCLHCFNGSIENNALCCPLCRLRIGSWLRTTTKQNNLVNISLWDVIKTKFPVELDVKLNGGDIGVEEEVPKLRISAPGEIRSEYEAELKRIKLERLQQESKHQEETELLISKLRQEEEEQNRKYLELLKLDEELAQNIQKNKSQFYESVNKKCVRKLRSTTIDNYLRKEHQPVLKHDSPLLTDDNTNSIDSSSPKRTIPEDNNSPELTPQYYRRTKTLIQMWNKDKLSNTESSNTKIDAPSTNTEPKRLECQHEVVASNIPALKYSIEKRNTDSTDSMNQELCHFQPINRVIQTSKKTNTGLPLRVETVKLKPSTFKTNSEPSRDQYLQSLCNLREFSLPQKLSSAFVIVNSIFLNHQNQTKFFDNTSPVKKTLITKKKTIQPDSIIRQIEYTPNVNETTPKKIRNKATATSTDKKNCLRSSSKKMENTILSKSPSIVQDDVTKNKFEIVIKNLSSPLKNCNVTKILEEQLRIEKMIEQEQKDLELAHKMDKELNGDKSKLRKPLVKRQSTLNYELRPSKKFKV